MRVRYRTFEFGDVDVHVRTLRDRNQFDDSSDAGALGVSEALWPLFGVVWDSGQVLARLMATHPVSGLRVLEVGCGIGLASLVLNHRDADITATDANPDAERFLARNVALNEGRPIPFVRTGWADAVSELGCFDLIIGSDLLYDRADVEALATFIDQHAKADCEIIVVDPGRGLQARFSRAMVARGYDHSQGPPSDIAGLDAPFAGQVLTFRRGAPPVLREGGPA
jgi:predicted nicotinamide N-methyase